MALTDHCDLFGSVHEDGVNLAGKHLLRQRPSLFNYGTAGVVANRKRWCKPIEVAEDVVNFDDPWMTVVPPLPVAGTEYGLEYCIQISDVAVDFHPESGTVRLPAELGSRLPRQRFGASASVCAGIACPSTEVLEGLADRRPDREEKEPGVIVLRAAALECFCIELYVVGGIERDGRDLRAVVDGIEIVDVAPEGLESGLECYLDAMVRLAILPRLRVAIPTMVFDLLNLATVTLALTPISGAVPSNPSIEQDELRAFLNVVVGP